ncbi:hypothetical protein Nepgr_014427 [Nepenthes gracilis]|uniref:Transmembrane protein n=1 Tax=Nepenthes gracilis TaxID=150966 RepID=A0AAD3XQA2_NEPGR|nr:hypothetical protein Nepgr_014427 [Nepenthes gracilis]
MIVSFSFMVTRAIDNSRDPSYFGASLCDRNHSPCTPWPKNSLKLENPLGMLLWLEVVVEASLGIVLVATTVAVGSFWFLFNMSPPVICHTGGDSMEEKLLNKLNKSSSMDSISSTGSFFLDFIPAFPHESPIIL